MMDGKHYKALIEDTQASDYDLVVMGALGMGAVKDSQLGSVTERFVRRVDARHADRPQPRRPPRRAGRHRGRPRRLAAVVPRPQARHRARPAPSNRPRAGGRRLRPLPALRDVQRHRGRAEREGLEDLPLQGAGAAARGDHRHRPGQDLPVAPGDRAASWPPTTAWTCPSRCSTASASRRS